MNKYQVACFFDSQFIYNSYINNISAAKYKSNNPKKYC